jgi:Pentapeptide repeats (8 copies)
MCSMIGANQNLRGRKVFRRSGKRPVPVRKKRRSRRWWIVASLIAVVLAALTVYLVIRRSAAIRFAKELHGKAATWLQLSNLPELLVVIGAILIFVLWLLPSWQAARSTGLTKENRFDRENEARKTLSQIVGGALLLAGLYSSVRTFDLQRQSEDLQQKGQIADRFTKAIDQLGAVLKDEKPLDDGKPPPNIEVRLGGIYALEGITHDSPDYQGTVMEILGAYVREKLPAAQPAQVVADSGSSEKRAAVASKNATPVRPRADILAALEVMGRRDPAHDGQYGFPNLEQVSFRDRDMSGVPLRNIDFRFADFAGANLDGTDLSGALLRWTNVGGCSLTGRT